MLLRDDQPGSTESDVDGAAPPPLCDEAEFAAIIEGLVADEAPQVFAVVQEYGERADGRIAAWGLAFPDKAEVFTVGGGAHFSLPTPERVLPIFCRAPHVSARIVWFNPDAPMRMTDDEDDT
jgi:hypothetical protein